MLKSYWKVLPAMRTGVATIALAAMAASGMAQTKVPPTSRTVYKCEVDKKVVYSDEPCLGAKRIDVEPTRGMDQLAGRKSTGSDVRRERNREAVADALKPLTGMNAQQLQTHGRRMKLSADAQKECKELDGTIGRAEHLEKTAAKDSIALVQKDLFVQRRRHKELGC